MRHNEPTEKWLEKAYTRFSCYRNPTTPPTWTRETVRMKLKHAHKLGCHADGAGLLVAEKESDNATITGLVNRILK